MRAPFEVGITVLAAGSASRFGSAKQLAALNGSNMISHCLEQCLQVDLGESAGCRVAVVIGGPHGDAVKDAIKQDVELLVNCDAEKGIGTSIRVAARWAREQDLHALLLVACDQILVTGRDLSSLVEKLQADQAKIVCAQYGDAHGIPAVFRSTLFEDLSTLKDSHGAKSIIDRRRDVSSFVSLPHAAMDVDVPGDLPAAAGLKVTGL